MGVREEVHMSFTEHCSKILEKLRDAVQKDPRIAARLPRYAGYSVREVARKAQGCCNSAAGGCGCLKNCRGVGGRGSKRSAKVAGAGDAGERRCAETGGRAENERSPSGPMHIWRGARNFFGGDFCF